MTEAGDPARKATGGATKKAVLAPRTTAARTAAPPIAAPTAGSVRKARAVKAPVSAKATTAKAPTVKAPTVKAPTVKAPTVKAPIMTTPAKAARKAAADPPVKRATTRRPITRRTGPASGSEPARATPVPPRFAGSRLAAEQTFADDPAPPSPPPGADPSARARALLRSAAAGIRAQEAASRSSSVYDTGYRSAPAETAPAAWPAAPAAPVETSQPAPVEPVEVEAVEELEVEPVEVEPVEVEPVEQPAPAEPVAQVLIAPRRRILRPAPVEPVAEAEWNAGDQPLEEEPAPDRIPDALDVLSVPGATREAPSRTAVRRFPPTAPPAPPTATPAPPAPVDEARPTAVTEPPQWTPPPPKEARSARSGRSPSLVRVLAAIVVLVVVVAGVVALIAARSNGTDYSKLKVGECFNSSKSNEVRGIDVKSCAEAHDSEVFSLVTHPAGPKDPYPGKDALVQFAADACLGKPLTDYIGTSLEQSKYKDFEIVPQESAWKDGRRVLVCGIDTGGQGAVKGSAKVTKPAS